MCTTHGGLVRQLQTALAGLVQLDPADQSDQGVRAALPVLLTAFHQLGAVLTDVVGVFDARDLAEADACRSAGTWLVAFDRTTGSARPCTPATRAAASPAAPRPPPGPTLL